MKNIELIDKAINKFNGVWPKAEFDGVDTNKWQEAMLLCLAPASDVGARHGEIHCGSTGFDSHYFELICTRTEFEARKAELQNKPDWDDVLAKHPEAQYLAQWSDGEWMIYTAKPEIDTCEEFGSGFFVTDETGGNAYLTRRFGEVIGDWRDTLEQRPNHIGEANEKDVEPEWPGEERIDIIGPNGNDGLHYATKAPEFKLSAGVFNLVDDDWHARGELPPVGARCLCWFDDGRECWHECFVIGSIDSEIKNRYLAASLIGKHDRKLVWANEFRPLRTEREKFIDAVMSLSSKKDVDKPEDLAGALFDAGFRLPEVK